MAFLAVRLMLALALAHGVTALIFAPASPRVGALRSTHRLRSSPMRMESLASKMFGDVFRGVQDIAKSLGAGEQPEQPTIDKAAGADKVVADLDKRAQSGDITFEDFLTMSRAFAAMDGGSSAMAAVLPGKLTDAELAETRKKIVKHEAIVEVMLDEERADPSLLVDDLKAGGSRPGPRVQRLAMASGQPETEVALFVMQFEAMRESTKRIAAGEDPEDVNQSMAAGPGANRAVRRASKKKKAGKKKM